MSCAGTGAWGITNRLNRAVLSILALTLEDLGKPVYNQQITNSLRNGLRLPDETGVEILHRYLRETDDIDAITEMLHETYGPRTDREPTQFPGRNWHTSRIVTGVSSVCR
jgi:hypothetical protein